MGTAAVFDQCTTVGTELVNPIITLPPNGLSTWKPPANQWAYEYDNFTVGEIWYDPSNQFLEPIAAGVKQLDLKDLACPTWGLGKSTAANGTVITTIGPPWLPLIVPPFNLFSLDPKWAAACTGLFSDQFALTTFALFDPPIALTPAAVLVPTPLVLPPPTPVPTPADPTTIPDPAKSSSKAAKPASIPNDPVAAPAKTENPEKAIPSQSPVIDPSDLGPLPDSSVISSKNKGDLPSETPSSLKEPSLSAVPGDPPVESIAPSTNAVDPPSGDSQKPASDPKVPIPVPTQGGNTQAQTQGLGVIIYNAFGKSGPDDDGAKGALNTAPLPPQSIFTIGAQTFTANPTGFSVDNAAMSPGGTAHTVDGTILSLDESGVLAIGSSTVSLTTPSPSTILAVAGQTFTPNPSAFSIAGSIISAGGPAVTVDGTTVSLDQSGALAIGSTTISLTDSWPTPFAPEAFTAAGQTFTPNPSAFPIAGTTVSVDGPAITVSGTVISLGQSGALRIGSSTISIASPSDPPPGKVYTIAGQIFTPNPSAFPIANTIISAGGPAATIDGTIISLGQSGALAIGSSTIPLASPPDPPPSKIYTVADQTFTPNPSAFSIAGTTLSAGGPAVTLDGTIISLQPSGTLLLGSSTIPLPLTPQTTFPSPSDITIIDGFHIEEAQSQPSFVVVDGVTLSAGASGMTISGAVVSLEDGGKTLDVNGTGHFALPTPMPIKGSSNGSETDDVQAFTGGGQGRGFSSSVSLPSLLLLLCGIWGMVMFAVSIGMM